jgi:serine/threonine protein kinase
MGEVYRAHDTRLHRDVAITILPDLCADDPDRLARFMREAQTLAALNHANIAHIHGLDETGFPNWPDSPRRSERDADRVACASASTEDRQRIDTRPEMNHG